jgi:hypothetical protein
MARRRPSVYFAPAVPPSRKNNPAREGNKDVLALPDGAASAGPAPGPREGRPGNSYASCWWLDAKQDDHAVTIQWSTRRGFGVSASALGDGYGEGPEETIERRGEATGRVLDLLRTKGHTVPPESVLLRELRGLVGVTQEELAGKLGVQQAAVSRLERRDDITLSSLRRFVVALGGDLEISVRTPTGGRVRLAGGVNSKGR